MSNQNPCSSCGNCNCTCECNPEPVAQAVAHMQLDLYGQVTKTNVNGECQWSLPCDLNSGITAIPREDGESLLCYYLRLFEDLNGGISSLRYEIFVDPVNGSDSQGDGKIGNPYATITKALSVITDNSSTNRYVIRASAGSYNESDLTWKSYVSLNGSGEDLTRINCDINFTGALNATSRIDLTDFQCNDISFDVSSSSNVNLRISRVIPDSVTWNGGGVYGIDNSNNCFIDNSSIPSLIITNGRVTCYSSLLTNISVSDASSPILILLSCDIKSSISITGRSVLITRSLYCEAVTFTGTVASATTPTWHTDASSLFNTTFSGTYNIVRDDAIVSTGSSSISLTNQRFVNVDATAGAKTVTIPAASSNKGVTFTIKKKDVSANAVTVVRTGSDTFDGATSVSLASQYDSTTIYSDGANWWIMASV